ncbi:MAG: copper resistance protein [Gammaproteobacteria bacterium]|nr:copper resistance protein [Gammaproteobacteria bacterium]
MSICPVLGALAATPPPAADEAKSAHASDPSLERPAATEQFTPAKMPGMDSDMNDGGVQHRVWIENLEGVYGTTNGGAWDAQAWLGGDFDKLWIKTEGATLGGKTQGAKVEALWARAILPFWDAQLGMRHDFSGGLAREWAALGGLGLTPYWFDVELTGYVGEEGRTAVRLKTEYDLYLNQRLILKPEIELNAYGKPDRARNFGAGLADGQFGLRLRYELTRRFAPYIGYVYDRKFAGSATLARRASDPAIDHRAVAGIQLFF